MVQPQRRPPQRGLPLPPLPKDFPPPHGTGRPCRRPPADKLAGQLKRISRKVSDLIERASQTEELADGVAGEIAALLRQLALAGGDDGGPEPGEVRRLKQELEQHYRHLAEYGTSEFSLKFLADGSAIAQVDRKEIRLSRTLAALLSVLAADEGASSDPLVAWKTDAEVAERLALELGRIVGRHALRQNLWRLRRRLGAKGVNCFLVQSRGSRMRFARRRQEAGENADEHAGQAGR